MRRQLRSRVLLLAMSLGLVAGGGCVEQATAPRPYPVPAVLSPEARAQLAPTFDVQAAEGFFQRMSQEDADRILQDMGVVLGTPPAETREVTVPISSSDPAVQALLDQMWAPSRTTVPNDSAGGSRYLGQDRSHEPKGKQP